MTVEEREVAALRERVYLLESFVEKWAEWCRAYPEEVFTPFTTKELREHSTIITRASAGMARHILKVMREDIKRLGGFQ